MDCVVACSRTMVHALTKRAGSPGRAVPMLSRLARYAMLGGALLSMLLATTLPARQALAQQDMMRIAAVVNDDVISIFDLAARLAVAIRSSGIEDSTELRRQLAPQVLRAMVDERLQAQEAKRLSITPTAQEIAGAIDQIERQNSWEKGSFDQRVESGKLNREVILDQIRTELAWGKIVRRKFGSAVGVSEEEVDEAVARIMANQGKPEQRVAEIFLPIDSAADEPTTFRTAEDLVEQLRAGSSFAAVARQFSKGATASQGGEIGWVAAGQLTPEVEQAVVALAPGEVSAPVRTFDGFYVVTVIERRIAAGGDAGNPSFQLAQVVLEPADGSASDSAVIRTLQASRDCASFLRSASDRAGAASGDLGTIALSDMPADLRAVVAPLEAGQVSPVMPYENGRRLIMVCDRTGAQPTNIDREAVKRDLGNRRLDLAARRYLRDLRRTAFIDLRI